MKEHCNHTRRRRLGPSSLQILLYGLRIRGFIRSVTAPFVHVYAVKVDGIIRGATSKVFSFGKTRDGIVVGRVTDGNGSKVVACHVRLYVTDGCFDKGRRVSVGVVVCDFVSGEETEGVVVLSEFTDYTDISFVDVDTPFWTVSVNRGRFSRCR